MKEKKIIVKRPPKTMKEKKFIQEYIRNGGNSTQAALKVYDTDSIGSASRIGFENTAKLSFEHYFEKSGLTDAKMAQNITRVALNSKKQNQFTGEIDNDDITQLKAMELAIKIMGKFAPPRLPVDKEGKEVKINLITFSSGNNDPL